MSLSMSLSVAMSRAPRSHMSIVHIHEKAWLDFQCNTASCLAHEPVTVPNMNGQAVQTVRMRMRCHDAEPGQDGEA